MGTKKLVAAVFAAALLMTANTAFADGDDVEGGEEFKIAHGGRLYDNWLEITNAEDPPFGDNPAYPKDKGKMRKGKSWMCLSCHGWDYKGKDGAFAKDERNATGIIGVIGSAGKDAEELTEVITGGSHGLNPDEDMIDEEEVEHLAVFISKGMVDTSKYIDASGKALGDAANGKKFYNTLCSGCHGLDGKMITDMPPIGQVTTEDPWKGLHTIRNGRPAEPMPAIRSLGDKIPGDVFAYAQTLPK